MHYRCKLNYREDCMRSVRYNLKENYGLSWFGDISISNAKRRVLSFQKINSNSQTLPDLHANCKQANIY